jgi:hypothetical protein
MRNEIQKLRILRLVKEAFSDPAEFKNGALCTA